MKRLSLFITILLFFSFISVNAQQSDTVEEDQSLVSQFQALEKKSGNYNANGIRYEVVRLSDLNRIKKSIFDSINTANASIKQLTATIEGNTNEIDGLNTKLQETTSNLTRVNNEKDSISFFGALLSKGTYKAIVWGIIAILTLLLFLFVYKFRNSNFLTQQAKSALAELETEYEDHRRKALEREQKVSRMLQDELNKQKK
ncbi:tRNA (guanine-N1)-methyltransferase [Flagellimonas sp. S174]|uniref:tRNA (guanine-N1)-methyltransferase n=1 Tax=Flagellimonas sp. S174 TaxID=3410790 RepID=UPI003BF4B742